MIRKLLFILITVFTGICAQAQITLTTTSTNAAWSPTTVTKSGLPLKWSVTGGITIPELVINDPTFDLSGNTGTATMTITSDDGFAGLTVLDFYVTPSYSGLITTVDVSDATALTSLNMRYNQLATLDVSQNTALASLIIRGGDQLLNQTLNTSTNTQLTVLRADDTGINSVDLSNNPLLTDVRLFLTRMGSAVLDQMLIDLDNHGLSNGNLEIRNQKTGQTITPAALAAYNSLIGKGWTIDVPAPIVFPPNSQVLTLTTASTNAAWSPNLVSNSGIPLKWAVSGGVTIPEVVINDPTFNLSGNTGTATVTITSDDGFAGLSNLDLYIDPAYTGLITSIDLTNTTSLRNLDLRFNQLTSLNVSQNTALTSLIVRGNDQIPDQALNTSANTQLTVLRIEDTGINSVDLSNNPLLTDVRLYSARLTSAVLDKVLIDLDNHGISNGNLQIAGNPGALTFNSLIAYNNLIAKGWTIDVPAPAAAPGPEINVTLEGTSIPTGNVPAIADGSDFGQVAVGSPVTKTVRIENLGDSPLTINGFFTTGGFTFVPPGSFTPTILAPGGIFNISVTFNSTAQGVQTGSITIGSTDPNENPYVINLRAQGVTSINNGTIVVSGNSVVIADGDTTPDVADDTNFGQVIVNGTNTNTFTIANTGTGNLTIRDILIVNFQNTEFSVEPLTFPFVVPENGTFDFDVTFSPLIAGNFGAQVQVWHGDTDVDTPYDFRVAGQGVANIVTGDIMISQYYEGSDNSRWIEVVNRSANVIPAGSYFLAMYDQTEIANIGTTGPSAGRSVSIPQLAPGQVVLFSNLAAARPTQANLGVPLDQVIRTAVCDFDGNDVILISSTNDASCYVNREDIIGTIPSTGWGSNLCLIRGGNSIEAPEINFNINNWIELSPAADVDVASTSTNIALGNQAIGKSIWDGSAWQNFAPDKTRDADIAGNYSSSTGNISAYDLVINAGVELNFNTGTTNSVIVNGNLTINGNFLIGDQESLVILKDNSITSGSITKFEKSTFRNNQHDVTYWSSPISNASIESVFSGVNPSRIFYYEQENSAGTDPNVDPTYWNTWVIASGLMFPGQGYAAEGPAGTTGFHDISFTGTPNNGFITFDIYQRPDGELDNDFNLVGNPYPSAIDIRRFFTLNAGVIWPEIFLWTHTTAISGGDSGDFVSSDYATYNLTGGTGVAPGEDPTYNIGSGQGFFVRGLEPAGGLIAFNNSLRIADLNDQFFKSEINKNKPMTVQNNENDRIWLNMTSDMGGFNQILIGFSQLSTSSVDKGYDALKKRSDNPLAFYSNINGEKYVIQGLGAFSEKDSEVFLGFDNKVAPRVLTISIDKAEGMMKNANVYLVDNLLNKTHDLQKGSYTFEQKTIGENPNRFTLKFTKSNAGGNIDKAKEGLFVVSVQDDNLKIRSDKSVRNLKVYDMFGRLLIEQEPNTDSFQLKTDKIKTGTVIIIESTFDDGTIVKRKSIKY